jgi:hypothetical protein
MSGLNNLMGRGVIPPVVHGVLDYPLAAVLIVLPLVLDFDDGAATWIAFAFGIGAAVLAVGTAWSNWNRPRHSAAPPRLCGHRGHRR